MWECGVVLIVKWWSHKSLYFLLYYVYIGFILGFPENGPAAQRGDQHSANEKIL